MAWDEIKMQREETLEMFIQDYQGGIIELADGSQDMAGLPDSFSARLKISGKCLLDLVLNFAYIFEVAEGDIISITAPLYARIPREKFYEAAGRC